MERLLWAVGVLLGSIAALGVAFMVSLRFQFPPVLRAIRRMNKVVFNPRALETAGTVGASASVVHHVGRTSGADYRTPVSAHPVEGGFLIPLPYGRTADWTNNVIAAEGAVIVHEGSTFHVVHPRVVPTTEAASLLPDGERRLLTTMGVAEVLRVDVSATDVSSEPLDTASTSPDA